MWAKSISPIIWKPAWRASGSPHSRSLLNLCFAMTDCIPCVDMVINIPFRNHFHPPSNDSLLLDQPSSSTNWWTAFYEIPCSKQHHYLLWLSFPIRIPIKNNDTPPTGRKDWNSRTPKFGSWKWKFPTKFDLCLQVEQGIQLLQSYFQRYFW